MDDGTLQFYRDNAQAYADWAKAPSTRLVRFLELLPSGASILELGCGAGNHSAVMLAEGFALRATDGSPEMAVIASRRLGHPVEAMRFDQLDAQEAYEGSGPALASCTCRETNSKAFSLASTAR